MTVISAQHVDCYEPVLAREMRRGEDHPEQPIGVLAVP